MDSSEASLTAGRRVYHLCNRDWLRCKNLGKEQRHLEKDFNMNLCVNKKIFINVIYLTVMAFVLETTNTHRLDHAKQLLCSGIIEDCDHCKDCI